MLRNTRSQTVHSTAEWYALEPADLTTYPS
jgi:hypothetical protein